jgi:hypothetical protein
MARWRALVWKELKKNAIPVQYRSERRQERRETLRRLNSAVIELKTNQVSALDKFNKPNCGIQISTH